MANNLGRIIETSSKISPPTSSRGISAPLVEQESEASPVPDLPSQPLIEKELRTQFHKISENIDSPKALLIIRNAALTVLELNELKLVGQENKRSLDLSSLLSLLTNSEYRQRIVERLISTTPNFWDESWDQAWSKDAEPLYSERQQRIVRRRSLISFWTKEWQSLPKEQVEHAVQIVDSLANQ
jgi:hypothetical protein